MIFHSEIVDTFGTIEREWSELLPFAVTQKVFLEPLYQKTWWETLGEGKLTIITVRNDQNTLVGVAPLFIHQNHLGFVGCKDVSDYLDFIVHQEFQTQVYAELVDQICQLVTTHQIKSAEFCSIPHDSPTLELLPDQLQRLLPAIDVQIAVQDVCPQIQLPNSYEEYLSSLDRKQRHEVKRKRRKLESEANVTFACLTTENEVTPALDTFTQLHQLSSQSKREFWTEHHLRFFAKLLPRFAQAGWLKLFLLELPAWKLNSFDLPLPAKPIATMLVFDYDQTYNLYNSGFDPKYSQLSVGQVLTAHTIEQAITDGCSLYDFLRGDESYKFRLGGQPKAVHDVSIHF